MSAINQSTGISVVCPSHSHSAVLCWSLVLTLTLKVSTGLGTSSAAQEKTLSNQQRGTK